MAANDGYHEHSLAEWRSRDEPSGMPTLRKPLAALLAFPLALAPSAALAADEPPPSPLRVSAMMGLAQWLVWGGGNVAAQVQGERFVFAYSHGQALDLSRVSFLTPKDERDAGVRVRSPWTTGGGPGLRLTSRLHVLVEVKAHRFVVTGRDANETTAYTSVTVGPGVFYEIPLGRGFFLQPNARFWPTVFSTYDGKSFTAKDGSSRRHARRDFPPFVNLNVGYTFPR